MSKKPSLLGNAALIIRGPYEVRGLATFGSLDDLLQGLLVHKLQLQQLLGESLVLLALFLLLGGRALPGDRPIWGLVNFGGPKCFGSAAGSHPDFSDRT